jgi:hypothetical protein
MGAELPGAIAHVPVQLFVGFLADLLHLIASGARAFPFTANDKIELIVLIHWAAKVRAAVLAVTNFSHDSFPLQR